jgi:hypothetical protein
MPRSVVGTIEITTFPPNLAFFAGPRASLDSQLRMVQGVTSWVVTLFFGSRAYQSELLLSCISSAFCIDVVAQLRAVNLSVVKSSVQTAFMRAAVYYLVSNFGFSLRR